MSSNEDNKSIQSSNLNSAIDEILRDYDSPQDNNSHKQQPQQHHELENNQPAGDDSDDDEYEYTAEQNEDEDYDEDDDEQQNDLLLDDEDDEEEDNDLSPTTNTKTRRRVQKNPDDVDLEKLNEQMDVLREQGYSFENPYKDEDDEWYDRFVEGKVDLATTSEEEEGGDDDVNGNPRKPKKVGFLVSTPTPQQVTNPLNNNDEDEDNNDNLEHDMVLQRPVQTNIGDNNEFADPNADPLGDGLVVEDNQKTQLADLVAKQMMVAAAMHTLEMAALDMRIAPKQVADVSNLSYNERKMGERRKQLQQQLTQHEQQQHLNYDAKERQAAELGVGMDEIEDDNINNNSTNSNASTTTTIKKSKIEILQDYQIKQLTHHQSLKPYLPRGQMELGMNAYELFNIPKHILAYHDEFFDNNTNNNNNNKNNTTITNTTKLSSILSHINLSIPQSFVIPYKQHLELQYKLYETDPDTRIEHLKVLQKLHHKYPKVSTTTSQYSSQILTSLNIPQHYMYNVHCVNNLHNLTQLSPIHAAQFQNQTMLQNLTLSQPHPMIRTPSLPSLSQQLSAMLLMKEIQRLGVLPYQLTLFHVLDVIIRICDATYLTYTINDVEDLFISISQQQAQQEQEQQQQQQQDANQNNSTISQTAQNILLQTIIEDIETSQTHTQSTIPRRYTIGREILGVLFSNVSHNDYPTPRELYTAQQKALTRLYAECLILRWLMARSWKFHIEQYNPDAKGLYATNQQTSEMPYYTSPLPENVSLRNVLNNNNVNIDSSNNNNTSNLNHDNINELYANKLITPPLPVWMYSITQSTMTKLLMLFVVYDSFVDFNQTQAEQKKKGKQEKQEINTNHNIIVNNDVVIDENNSDNSNNNNSNDDEDIIEDKLYYMHYLDLTPPPPFNVPTMAQDYEEQKAAYDAHLLCIGVMQNIKTVITNYLIANNDDEEEEAEENDKNNNTTTTQTTTYFTQYSTNNTNCVKLIQEMPLLLTSDWLPFQHDCLKQFSSILYTRFPDLLLPVNISIQVPFLVVLMLSNDAEERQYAKQQLLLESLATKKQMQQQQQQQQQQEEIIKSDNVQDNEDGNEDNDNTDDVIISKEESSTSKSKQTKGTNTKKKSQVGQKKKKLSGSGSAKVKKTKSQQHHESLHANVWGEKQISTNTDNDDEIENKLAKEKARLDAEAQLQQMLESQNEYNLKQQIALYPYYYLYPIEVPFVPKLPPLPVSFHQYRRMVDYHQQEYQAWANSRDTFVQRIERMIEVLKEYGEYYQPNNTNNTNTTTDQKTNQINDNNGKPTKRSQIDKAVSDLSRKKNDVVVKDNNTHNNNQDNNESDVDEEEQDNINNNNNKNNEDDNNDNNQQLSDDITIELDQIEEFIKNIINNNNNSNTNNDLALQLPSLTMDDLTTIKLPQEHFGNLTATSLFELCQHGAQQYQQTLQKQREVFLQKKLDIFKQTNPPELIAKLTDEEILQKIEFTAEDLTNLTLFPNGAVDNAYEYIAQQNKQKLLQEEEQEKYLDGGEQRAGVVDGDDDDDVVRQGDEFAHLNKTNAKTSIDMANITSTLQSLDDDDDDGNSIVDGQQQQQQQQKDAEFEYAQIAKLGQLDAATITAQVRSGVLQQFQQQNKKQDDQEDNNLLVDEKGNAIIQTADDNNNNNIIQPTPTGPLGFSKLPTSLTLLEQSNNNAFNFDNSLIDDVTTKPNNNSNNNKSNNNNDNTPLNMNANIFPDEKRDMSNISKTGGLLLPYVQNIPFVFDVFAQIANYNTKEIYGTTSNDPFGGDNDQQPNHPTQKPIRYLGHAWVDDTGVDVVDRSIALFTPEWTTL